MLYGILLILVLVITGGAIAFIGDRLGTKIGKKRLSLFGLRPRHTSIVITIFTGICISTLTLGVSAAVSQNVRTALFGMERLHQSMVQTQQKLDAASDALARAQDEQQQTNAALEQSKSDVEKLQAQQEELRAESERLEEGNRILQLANEALNSSNADLMAENDSLASRNDLLVGQNEKLTFGNKELSQRNDILTQVNNVLGKRTEELQTGLISMREGDITFRAGEILASGVIQGNRSQETVEADLQSLAQLANRNVSARLGINLTDQGLWIYQPEAEAAIKAIAESPQDMVVRIVAAGNLVRGEVVRASLELYKNSIIYGSKELIIAKPYTLRRHDEEEAEMVAMDFLMNVNQAAVIKGILPDPILGSVGVIEGTQFYNLVQNLQNCTDHIVLSAYARDATDALGPLRVDFKLEPAQDADGIYPVK